MIDLNSAAEPVSVCRDALAGGVQAARRNLVHGVTEIGVGIGAQPLDLTKVPIPADQNDRPRAAQEPK